MRVGGGGGAAAGDQQDGRAMRRGEGTSPSATIRPPPYATAPSANRETKKRKGTCCVPSLSCVLLMEVPVKPRDREVEGGRSASTQAIRASLVSTYFLLEIAASDLQLRFVGEVHLSSFGISVLGKAAFCATTEDKSVWNAKKELAKLERSLNSICAGLKNAERKQSTSCALQVCLENLKERNVANKDLEQKLCKGFFGWISRLLAYLFELAHWIKEVRGEIAANGREFALTEELKIVESSRVVQGNHIPSSTNWTSLEESKRKTR